MSEAILRPLSPAEAELYQFLTDGGSRLEFARHRGVTKAAVSHLVNNLRGKGYDVPEPLRKPSPRYDEAKGYFRLGLSNPEVGAKMGITRSLVCSYRRKWEAEK